MSEYVFYVKRAYEYLVHHGIKGIKWGVRRYQNKDGSYTSAGKKHTEDCSTYLIY